MPTGPRNKAAGIQAKGRGHKRVVRPPKALLDQPLI